MQVIFTVLVALQFLMLVAIWTQQHRKQEAVFQFADDLNSSIGDLSDRVDELTGSIIELASHTETVSEALSDSVRG